MRSPNKYCHDSQEVSKYLSANPEYYKQWWNYVTALRGCDVNIDSTNTNALKAVFTCTLRGCTFKFGTSMIAWDVLCIFEDGFDYYNMLINEWDQQRLIKILDDDNHIHYKNHLMFGFEALAFYNKRLYDDTNDNMYEKCGSILNVIGFDMKHNCSNSLFKHIHEFLLLISDEVENE